MNKVNLISVSDDEDGMRLDRWFRAHYPNLTHGALQKLMRTGQVRLDGGRVKTNARIISGQQVRIPPLSNYDQSSRKRQVPFINPEDQTFIENLILHIDDQVIVLNKPSGLAVQGGSKTHRHIDGMLHGLTYGLPERPKLVHRLDRDTSGILLIARTSNAARALTASFKQNKASKLYWSMVEGIPKPESGTIDLPLIKQPGYDGERVVVDYTNGKKSQTRYRVLDHAGKKASLIAMEPLTGRTHQLRVHAISGLGMPLLGDGKYGGSQAFPEGIPVEQFLYLHARRIIIPHPNGEIIDFTAPVPDHFNKLMQVFGFEYQKNNDFFLEELE